MLVADDMLDPRPDLCAGLVGRLLTRGKRLAAAAAPMDMARHPARGEIVLAARRFRTQEANRADARDRLTELLVEAQTLPLRRAKSRLNRVGKTKRLAGKKLRGAVKAGRGRVTTD